MNRRFPAKIEAAFCNRLFRGFLSILPRLSRNACVRRRWTISGPWYRLIALVGDKGVDEYFLDPVPVANTSPQAYRDTIKTERSGELFLYVNDAVIGPPWLYDWFYGPTHHHGKAKVTVRML